MSPPYVDGLTEIQVIKRLRRTLSDRVGDFLAKQWQETWNDSGAKDGHVDVAIAAPNTAGASFH